jgi:MFS family permease
MVVLAAPNDRKGRALGILYFVSSVMALSASIATGELWKHLGARVPFYLSAGLAVLAAVLVTASVPRPTRD